MRQNPEGQGMSFIKDNVFYKGHLGRGGNIDRK